MGDALGRLPAAGPGKALAPPARLGQSRGGPQPAQAGGLLAPNAPSPAFDPEDASDSVLQFPDNRLLIDLCGELDRNIAQIEARLGLTITRRGNQLMLHGEELPRAEASRVLRQLYARLEQGRPVGPGDVDAAIRLAPGSRAARAEPGPGQLEMFSGEPLEIRTRRKVVEPRTAAQKDYVRALFRHELVFGLGPAGTGKTYLAVAAAVAMFIEGHVDRIVLSRPAVEAGERLGFLPGDMKEKVDPYMQPLYDALNDFFPARQVAKMIEERQIEIAPLAFMRGRTLANAFVVLDEAQNATTMQMKMFLTRLGEGSRMAVTGDTTQIDLPRGVASGLVEAERILRGVEGIGFVRFTAADVVRHALVARIITAYEAAARE
jgi:phosphate starvation-inducible PhoH-like protein